MRPSAAGSIATSAPSSSASARFSSLEAVAITRPAPSAWPSCTAIEPTPPAAPWTTTLSPSATRAAVRYRCQAVVPWTIIASAVPSSRPSGIAKTSSLRRDRVLGVAAAADERDHALAGVLAHARDLAAGHQRQRGLLHVGVGAGVRVGEVQAGARDPDQRLLGTRLAASGSSASLSTSGPPNSVIWIARIWAEASGVGPVAVGPSGAAGVERSRTAAPGAVL